MSAILKNKNTQQKKNIVYLSNLVALANSDGEISPEELKFLQLKAQELGLTDELVDTIARSARYIRLSIPEKTDHKLKMKYLHDCITMVCADGILKQPEKALCIKICQDLQLDTTFLKEALALKKVTEEQ